MSRPINLTLTGVTADTDSIAASQSPGSGAILINGDAATLVAPARVTIGSGGDDHLITFTIIGTNRDGNPQTETIAGTNGGTATSTQDFKAVTSITASGAVASTLVAGNSNTMSTQWIMADYHNNQNAWSIATVLSAGSATWSVEYTLDDPNSPYTGAYPTVFAYGPMTAQTASMDSQTGQYPAIAWRVTLTTGTGTVKSVFLQAGLAGH